MNWLSSPFIFTKQCFMRGTYERIISYSGFSLPYVLSRRVSNLQTEVAVSKKWIKLDVYIIFIFSFPIPDPSRHTVKWWSRMSSFIDVCRIFKNSLLLCDITSSAYGLFPLFYLIFCYIELKHTNHVINGISSWINFLAGLPCHVTNVEVLTIVDSVTQSAALLPMTERTFFCLSSVLLVNI